jgi:D-alanine-D-alanine ligase
MSLLNVAVIYGGPSREHEISLKTGQAMIDGLDRSKYSVTSVFISKDGKWQISNGQFLGQETALKQLKTDIDICMLGLHGTFGEDGQIQALLEDHAIRYTGSDSKASKLAMEKHKTSDYYQAVGLNVPAEIAITSWQDSLQEEAETKFGFPIVVKPESQGSSVGVSIVENVTKLRPAVEAALAQDSVVLLQQYISGREVSCGVLEIDGELEALLPTEVEPVDSRFYDYDAKYTVGATKETTPPENMDQSLITRIQEVAIKAHQTLGCSGYSRTDIIIDEDTLYVIETNTLPGMTVTSFLPQQVAAIGKSFSWVLDVIIQAALKK